MPLSCILCAATPLAATPVAGPLTPSLPVSVDDKGKDKHDNVKKAEAADMAALIDADRYKVLGHAIRLWAWPALTKADVRAAVDATDDWIDSNQTSYNNALPVPFRTTATLTQKTILFAYVALRRAGILKVEGE